MEQDPTDVIDIAASFMCKWAQCSETIDPKDGGDDDNTSFTQLLSQRGQEDDELVTKIARRAMLNLAHNSSFSCSTGGFWANHKSYIFCSKFLPKDEPWDVSVTRAYISTLMLDFMECKRFDIDHYIELLKHPNDFPAVRDALFTAMVKGPKLPWAGLTKPIMSFYQAFRFYALEVDHWYPNDEDKPLEYMANMDRESALAVLAAETLNR